MKVSVIGARGFIGSALCAALKEAGCDIHAPARDDMQRPKGGWGRLVWAAGLTANFRQKPMETIQAHVSDLAQLLQGGGVDSLMYLSSTRVYQRCAQTSEEVPLACLSTDPSDLYNLSKLMGESLCLNAGVEQVKIARLSNIIGAGEAARATFIGALCREAQAGQITLQSAPASEKDYLWISDAAAYLSAMALDDHCGVFNVASGVQIRHHDWANAIAGATNAQVKTDITAPDGGFVAINVTKLQAHYGPAKINLLEKIEAITRSPQM